nr:hypothetical protein [Streptomyces sp. NEAU-H3]
MEGQGGLAHAGHTADYAQATFEHAGEVIRDALQFLRAPYEIRGRSRETGNRIDTCGAFSHWFPVLEERCQFALCFQRIVAEPAESKVCFGLSSLHLAEMAWGAEHPFREFAQGDFLLVTPPAEIATEIEGIPFHDSKFLCYLVRRQR